jgi:hypothetical protein
MSDVTQILHLRTADRLWAFARVWLLREVGGDEPGDQGS